MSNLIINIRFWYWHLQVTSDHKIMWRKNEYLVDKGLKGRNKIEIHKFFKYI